MLPEIPKLPGVGVQFEILQSWLGLGSLLLIVAGIYISIKKMNAPTSSPKEDMGAQMYFSGPIMETYRIVRDISDRVGRIERKLDEFLDSQHRHRR